MSNEQEDSEDLFYRYVVEFFNNIITWLCTYITEISWQLLIALISYMCICILLYYLLNRVDQKAWQLPGLPGKLLLVTAHPDDEVMFFGPLVYQLTQYSNIQVHLLCLSMGGDKKRKDELWECAKRMGIPDANVTVVMATELPDDPLVQWPEEVVIECILEYVETYKINAVVTFDKHGVSNHRNHSSLFYAVATMCMEKKVPNYCKLYTLESVNIIRKYSQILDLPISLLTSSYWYIISYSQRKEYIKNAMEAHESQYVWFRRLYMIFSRYTLINTLNEVSELDLELDLQFDDEDD